MQKWKCEVCGQVFEGNEPPIPCPVCGAGEDAFTALEQAKVSRWHCNVCGQEFDGENPPVPCPVCGASEDAFEPVAIQEDTFQKDTEERFVIIGGGVAGLETAKAIRQRNQTASITIVAKEHFAPYNRPALSDVVGDGMSYAAILLEDEEFYQTNRIVLLNDSEVTHVDTNTKVITLDNEKTIQYDKCCFTLGASAFNPIHCSEESVPCTVLRDYLDAKRTIELGSNKKVTIIGGGILGIEAAVALRERGAEVLVLEMAERIMGMQVDNQTSEWIQTRLDKKGIRIRTKVNITGLDQTGVCLLDGTHIDSEFVLVSAGIRSNLTLAQLTGIEVGRGILVNESMQTNIPDIYAAGDCAEFEGSVQGLWATAIAQAGVAGANMAGESDVHYVPIVPALAFETLGIALFSAGTVNAEREESVIHKDEYQGIYRKLIFQEKKLVGVIFYGDTKGSGAAISLIANQAKLKEALQVL